MPIPRRYSGARWPKAVGVSATTIYIYYRNIDDLLHHLRMEGFALLIQHLQDATGDSALERILGMGRAYFLFGTEHSNYYEMMFFHRFRELPKAEIIQREVYALTLLRDVVKSGIEQGEIRRDIDLMVLDPLAPLMANENNPQARSSRRYCPSPR